MKQKFNMRHRRKCLKRKLKFRSKTTSISPLLILGGFAALSKVLEHNREKQLKAVIDDCAGAVINNMAINLKFKTS